MKSIIISSILSLVITGHNPVSFSYPANIITTPYGTCTYYYSLGSLNQDGFSGLFNGIIFDSDLSMTFIHYEFAGQATGQFDLPVFTNVLNNTALTSNYRLFVQGGYLISTPNISGGTEANALRFQVVDSRSMDILIIHPGWNQPAITVPNLYNQNITLEQTENATVNDILTYTESINNNIFTIKTDVTTIKNKLLQSLGYGSSGDTIETDLKKLQQLMYWSTVPVGSYNAYSLFGFLGDLSKTSSDAMPYYIISNTAPQYMLYLTAGVTYYMSMIVENPYYYGMSGIIQVVNSNTDEIVSSQHYIDYNNLRSTYTMKITPIVTGTYTVKFRNDFNNYIIGKKLIPLFFGTLDSVDSDTAVLTHLPSNINTRLDTIIDKIANMAVNVNNMTVNATGITYNVNNTEVNNSVTTYNTNINQVYNIENNISADFNNYNQQFNPDFSTSLTALQDTSTMMNGIITQINGIQLFTVPILLTLAGIVLLAILG